MARATALPRGRVPNGNRTVRHRQHPRSEVLTLVGPGLVVAVALVLLPVAFAVVMSLYSWEPSGDLGAFVGIDNFVKMVHDEVFWSSFRVTAQIFLVGLVVQTALGVIIGYLVSLEPPGHRIFGSLILLPAIIAPVAAGLIWLLIYDPTLGLANHLLGFVGLGPVNWLGDPDVVVWSILLADTWQWTPLIAVIVAASIRALPKEPFEAAAMDGAPWWRIAWHVGLPLLRPAIAVTMVIRSVDLIRYFDLVYVMTRGGPVNSSTTLNVYAYQQGFLEFEMSYSSALQLAIIVVVACAAAALTALRRRWVADVSGP